MTITEDRALIDAARASDAELARVVAAVGADSVADLLVEEIAFRASLSELTPAGHPVQVALVFSHEGRTLARTIGVAGQVRVDRGAGDRATASVGQQLLEVVRALFGPSAISTSPTRSVTWPGLWPDFESLAPRHYPPREMFESVRRIVDVLDRREVGSLAGLAVRYRTDKWGLHQYTPHYERHFAHLRESAVQVLEIGVGGQSESDIGGESLKMWKHYFPRGIVRGIDIENKQQFAERRIDIATVDQSDVTRLREYAGEIGAMDVIIDDGSHLSADIIASFHTLFPFLRDGGVYVIEDVQTSYWAFDGGNSSDLNDPGTSMGFLKSLVDGLNHEEFLSDSGRVPAVTDDQISGIHFYHNIVFIEKASNTEGSPIARALEKTRIPATGSGMMQVQDA